MTQAEQQGKSEAGALVRQDRAFGARAAMQAARPDGPVFGRRPARSAATPQFFTRQSGPEETRPPKSPMISPSAGMILGAGAILLLSAAIPAGFLHLAGMDNGAIDRVTTGSIPGLSVQLERLERGGDTVAVVSGRFVNQTGESTVFPVMAISLVDKSGTIVQSWRHYAGSGMALEPGESMTFTATAIDITGQSHTARAEPVAASE